MHVEHQRQLMMREKQQKQATAAALAATSSTSTTPSAADSTRTPSAASPGVPGNSQQQQGSKRQLTLTVSTLPVTLSLTMAKDDVTPKNQISQKSYAQTFELLLD